MEKSLSKINKSFTSRMQARLLLVFCVVTLLLVVLMGRLIYIMQTDGDRYAKHVLSRQSQRSSVIPFKRGSIIDRNGTVLAQSELQYRLILDAKRLNQNPDAVSSTAKALNDYFNIKNETVLTLLQEKKESQYITLLKNLKYDEVQSFETLMKDDDTIVGIWFDEEYIRTYPYNTLACDVLGFSSVDNKGYWGIEEYYNEELNGSNGREYGYYDSSLNIERIVKEAENGNSIVSTIDANAQRIIQKHINEFNAEFGSKNIGILVMDPNNGEILAMASSKEYNLNKPQDLTDIYTKKELDGMTEEQKTEKLNELWKNDVISSGFEPGSTFKPITIAAGLEESVITPESTYLCDGGEQFGSSYIHCNKRTGHGEITLGEALILSCNDALMQIAAQEGKDIFYGYETSFGLGRKTGIDLPGEAAGIIISYDKLKSTELATSSFGQSFNTTMIQLATAFSSLVNGGYYYQPHVVKQIINDKGATLKNFNGVLVRQTVSDETSDFIQEYLYQTVENGTAGGAKVEGYSIGGKTGTAQKYPRDAKTYVVSFLGSVPAVNPEIVIYVMVDEPQNVEKQADSSIATKFASRILKELLPALGIYPEGDIDYLLSKEGEIVNSTNGSTTNGNTAGNTESAQNSNNSSGTQEKEEDGSNNENTNSQNEGQMGIDLSQSGTGNTSEDDNTTEEPDNSTDTGPPEDGGDAVNGTNSEDDEYNPDALD